MRSTIVIATAVIMLVGVSVSILPVQRGGVFQGSRDHPAIRYSLESVDNVVSRLNLKIADGSVKLNFIDVSGYLRSVLDALDILVESQVAVFSRTSFQAELLSMNNPRAIYFTDDVAVAFVRGGEVLEVAAQDRQQGTIFYTLKQTPVEVPQFVRNDSCLSCHLSWDTLGVPGLQVLTTFPMSSDPNAYAAGFASDHRSPISDRWGGWYVNGKHEQFPHMGNIPVRNVDDREVMIGTKREMLESLDGLFDLTGYSSSHSDIAALMVLEHQAHMANLLTRIGWEARRLQYRDEMTRVDVGMDLEDRTTALSEAVVEFVDYLLFIDEAPLPVEVESMSGFADRFIARGPHDRKGRSLRELDLSNRLFLYPCSYMIYSEMFNSLIPLAKDAIYERLWHVLSGELDEEVYDRLSLVDRQAIVEILRDTKPDLPDYFQSALL
jgi:hypothetical protein